MAYVKNEKLAVERTYDLTNLSPEELGVIIMGLKSLPTFGEYGDLLYKMKDDIEDFKALESTMVTSFTRRLIRLLKS